MRNSRNIFALSIILLFATALRAWHLLAWIRTPYFNGLFLDELYHHIWAQHIANGEIVPSGVFFRAPLYPYLLAAMYSIFGDGGLAPRILQHVWGVFSIFAVFLASREIFDDDKISLMAAAIWAFCPTQIFFESRLLLDSFFAAGMMWSVWLLLLVRRKRSPAVCAAFGLSLGALAITRPTAIIIVPIALVYLWKYVRWRTLIACIAIAVPIAPVTISNVVNGDLVPIASQGGINFYIGNNSKSNGASAVVPELGWNWQYRQCVEMAQRETGKKMKPSDVSRFFTNKGLRFWREKPGNAVTLFAKKTILLITSPEIGNNGNIYFLTRTSPLRYILWFWALIFPLAVVGCVFGRFKNRWLIITMLISYSIGLALFFICSRFRLPLVAIMSLPAAGGLECILRCRKKRKTAAVIMAIFIFVISLLDPYGWRRNDDALSHFALGNIFLRRNDSHRAITEFNRALEINATARGVSLNKGVLYFKRGELDSAEMCFKNEIDARGEICRAMTNLGVIERLRGNFTMAMHYGDKSMLECFDDPAAIYNYAMTLYSAGYLWKADSVLRENLPQNARNPRYLNLTGAVAIALHDTAMAESLWTEVLARSDRSLIEWYDMGTIYNEQAGVGATPLRVRCWAYHNLAQVSAARGKLGEAEKLLNLAIVQDSTFAVAYAALGAIYLARNKLDDAEHYFLQSEKRGHHSAELYFNLAAVAARGGDFTIAREFLKESLQIKPGFKPAEQALKALIENH